MQYIFNGRCSIYSMTVEAYLLRSLEILEGLGSGFLATGLSGVNDGHY